MRLSNINNRFDAYSGNLRRLLPAKKAALGSGNSGMSAMPLTKPPRCGVSIACNRYYLKKNAGKFYYVSKLLFFLCIYKLCVGKYYTFSSPYNIVPVVQYWLKF